MKFARLKGPDQPIVIQLEGAHSLTDLNDRYSSALQLQRQISSVYLNDFVSLDELEVPAEGLSPNHELRTRDRRNLDVGPRSDLNTARFVKHHEGFVYLSTSGINFQPVAAFERDSRDGGFERALHRNGNPVLKDQKIPLSAAQRKKRIRPVSQRSFCLADTQPQDVLIIGLIIRSAVAIESKPSQRQGPYCDTLARHLNGDPFGLQTGEGDTA